MEQLISSSKKKKTRLQRVKKIFKRHVVPVVLSVAVLSAVLFGSAYRAYATGMEEFFYYTYFDLISGLFAETGQQFSLKDEFYTKPDRVSGKQVWDNFCTWVENKAKVAALPVEVVNKAVFDELKNLPNTVTSAGAEMSEKLSELLAKILPTFGTDSFSSLTENSLLSFLHATSDYDILPAVSSYLDAFNQDLSNGYKLNVVKDENEYFLFVSDPAYSKLQYIQDKSYSYPVFKCYGYKGNSRREIDVSRIYSSSSSKQVGVGAKIRATEPVWIVKEGNYVASDGTSINDYAKVKKVDDNTVYVPGVGYKTNWDILKDILNDRVTTDAEEEAWNSRYNFDKDNKDDKEKKKKDNEKDKLPVAIPIVFPNKKPDSTEKDTEKDTESGVPGKDPSKNPMINPDTGRYIDPDTGYDIDPDTGKLIDPDTGELIEPDIPSTAGKAGNWKRLFPFCIPWDMMELIKSMQADKKAPVFEFKYTFKAVNYTWVVRVDMSDYWKYIKIFRWGMTIFFIIGLFFLTVKFTTFVQRMGG